ncbi:MAG TPA: IS5 family transposase [Fibrobacteria bacterium]|nr:IS5 family transposase [Fibrobacteria bacterium]
MNEPRKLRSWEISDDFWELIEPLIPEPMRPAEKKYKRKAGGGRKALPRRRVLEAIMYVARTGIQWKALPRERFGSASSVHAYFQKWVEQGVFQKIWKAGLMEYEEMEGIGWKWQSVDGSMVKAPLAQEAVGKNPTDRGKNGTKRSLLADEPGVPLSIVVSGANTHDCTLLEQTLEAIVLKRSRTNPATRHQLCLDAGYVGMKTVVWSRSHGSHIRPRNEENPKGRKHKPKRWVVERTHSWLNRFRKLLVRYEKKACNYLGLLQFICGIIAWRQVVVIYG